MNTRLQVEHPVTESVSGLDLVALQLRRRRRRARCDRRPPARRRGTPIEARLYAEDPAPRLAAADRRRCTRFDVLPWTGSPRAGHAASTPDGDGIGVHYDPMLAKVIAWAPTRAEPLRRLAARPGRAAKIHGLVTNRDLLVDDPAPPEAFAWPGGIDTAFFDRRPGLDTDAGRRWPRTPLASALAAALADATGPATPPAGRLPGGWRNVSLSRQRQASSRAGRSGE